MHVSCCLKMNSGVIQDIISLVFHEISKGSFLCKICFLREIQCHNFSLHDMLIHIYFGHRGLWNAYVFQSSSLSSHVWQRLFEFSDHSLVRCKTCPRTFLNTRLRDLHHHTRTQHGILLLALSLSNLN